MIVFRGILCVFVCLVLCLRFKGWVEFEIDSNVVWKGVVLWGLEGTF